MEKFKHVELLNLLQGHAAIKMDMPEVLYDKWENQILTYISQLSAPELSILFYSHALLKRAMGTKLHALWKEQFLDNIGRCEVQHLSNTLYGSHCLLNQKMDERLFKAWEERALFIAGNTTGGTEKFTPQAVCNIFCALDRFEIKIPEKLFEFLYNQYMSFKKNEINDISTMKGVIERQCLLQQGGADSQSPEANSKFHKKKLRLGRSEEFQPGNNEYTANNNDNKENAAPQNLNENAKQFFNRESNIIQVDSAKQKIFSFSQVPSSVGSEKKPSLQSPEDPEDREFDDIQNIIQSVLTGKS